MRTAWLAPLVAVASIASMSCKKRAKPSDEAVQTKSTDPPAAMGSDAGATDPAAIDPSTLAPATEVQLDEELAVNLQRLGVAWDGVKRRGTSTCESLKGEPVKGQPPAPPSAALRGATAIRVEGLDRDDQLLLVTFRSGQWTLTDCISAQRPQVPVPSDAARIWLDGWTYQADADELIITGIGASPPGTDRMHFDNKRQLSREYSR